MGGVEGAERAPGFIPTDLGHTREELPYLAMFDDNE